MSDAWLAMVKEKPPGARPGSWLGATVCALGISACLTIVVQGGMKIMDAGGFVASGGPYQITHPVPSGFWVLPLAFTGLFAFSLGHAIFASRIQAPGLAYATWCALWTAVGASTLWYGLGYPTWSGPAWGWLVMGGVFLLVGLGSVAAYLASRNFIERKSTGMTGGRLAAYWAVTGASLLIGVLLGTLALAAA